MANKLKKKVVIDSACAKAAFQAFARAAGYDMDDDMDAILVALPASIMAWQEDTSSGEPGGWFYEARQRFEDKYQPREDD